MEFVQVNGIQLSYTRQGIGTPLVLLHGYPLDHSIWLEIAGMLQDRFEVIMPDLRGFGLSTTTGSNYALADAAADIIGLLDALGIRKACIAGHSMGGYVALSFSTAYSDRVAGLGLVSTQALADSPERQQVRLATARQVEQEGVGFIAASMPEKLSPDPSVRAVCEALIRAQSPEGVIGALTAMAGRVDSSTRLVGFDFPVCIVHGTQDALIPLDRAREMKAALPAAYFMELEGVGHMPMLESPADTAQALSHLA
jgi:pimeloyl-ACP methyl ester carboxylesterase